MAKNPFCKATQPKKPKKTLKGLFTIKNLKQTQLKTSTKRQGKAEYEKAVCSAVII